MTRNIFDYKAELPPKLPIFPGDNVLGKWEVWYKENYFTT